MAHTSTTLLTQMAIDPADRPRYSREQLAAYFQRIKLPKSHLDSPVLYDPSLASSKEHGIPLLKALQLYHVSNIPFENLELHYSAKRKISLNMDDLYDVFVARGQRYGRGGRCMENNGFFGTVLRSIGYDVRNCAGRVSRSYSADPVTREKQGDTYDSWNHMLNLVRIEKQWYVVDVGTPPMGPNLLYPLQDGFETVAIPPRKIRLQKRPIPEHYGSGDDAQKLWCYDICFHPDQVGQENQWLPTYCFTEMEFLPQDYEMMSFYTSHNPSSFFTYSVLCSKMLLDEESQTIVGDITLFNDSIRKTVGGKREVVADLKIEAERVAALKDVFGVELTEEEQSHLLPERRLGQ